MTDNGHYYSAWVDARGKDQGYDTGYGQSSDTVEKARADLLRDIRFVLGNGKLVTKAGISRVCCNCNGYGAVFVPQKRNPRLGKNKRCPECKGKNADVTLETWVDIPGEYRQELADVEEERIQ